ncbi:9483_t:CDS:2, partial [Funneliformis geosporum]
DRIAEFLSKLFEKWNLIDKVIAEVSDNARNMINAFQSFNYQPKILNNALVCRDKYRETLRNVQQLINKNNSKILDPIQDVTTRWNSNYAVLQRLLFLKNAIYSLDLLNLLKPFVQITDIIGGSTYPTLIAVIIIRVRDSIEEQILNRWQDI